MHRHRAFIVATWLAFAPSSILFPETFGAEPMKDAAYYQNQLDRADWRWDESHEGLVYSMTQSAREYRIEMIRLPRADDHLTIRFLKGTRLVCSWDGHFQSVFVQEGNTLVYAQFEPTRGGCTLVAVNFDTGQDLWRTNLKGVVDQAGHSLYSNRVQLYASDDSIMVLGMESRGNYAEIVDMKTGKTLAHRLYEQETRKGRRPVQRP
jgi:hypothetical protein